MFIENTRRHVLFSEDEEEEEEKIISLSTVSREKNDHTFFALCSIIGQS